MKRLSAIILSLLLLTVQVFATAQPFAAGNFAESGCCTCDRDCCVSSPDSSDSIPQPIAPASSVAPVFHPYALALFAAWTLPCGEATVFSFTDSSPQHAARIPLFTWNCALLI